MLAILAASGLATNGVLAWIVDILLLRPERRPVGLPPSPAVEEVQFTGAEDVPLLGWRFRTAGERRGTIVYLHGVAANRTSANGIAERFTPRGFDVIAYDSRAHGQSGGEYCTYGYYEKQDLQRVLDTIEASPIVLMGNSMGAAVILQAAAEDDRVAAVVAAETFDSLGAVVRHRAPAILNEWTIRRVLSLAERRGNFPVDAVSPVMAASRITAPVLLIHGAADRGTPPEHSQRVFAALPPGAKQLILVPEAGHNESLKGEPIWAEIAAWIDAVLATGSKADR